MSKFSTTFAPQIDFVVKLTMKNKETMIER